MLKLKRNIFFITIEFLCVQDKHAGLRWQRWPHIWCSCVLRLWLVRNVCRLLMKWVHWWRTTNDFIHIPPTLIIHRFVFVNYRLLLIIDSAWLSSDIVALKFTNVLKSSFAEVVPPPPQKKVCRSAWLKGNSISLSCLASLYSTSWT